MTDKERKKKKKTPQRGNDKVWQNLYKKKNREGKW